VAEFYYLLVAVERHTMCWKWEENQNKFFQKHILKQLQTFSGLAWCDSNTHQITNLCALISPTDQNLSKISSFSARTNRKNIPVYQWPHKGTNFRSDLSVTVSNIMYVYPVFRGDLVLFNFHSDAQLFFFFCFSGSYFFSLWSKL